MNDQDLRPVWSRCPRGTIDHLARQRQSVNRRQLLRSVALSSTTIIAATGLGAFFLSRRRERAPMERLTCDAVLSHLDDFYHQRLDATMCAMMRSHFAACPPCYRIYDQRYPDQNV